MNKDQAGQSVTEYMLVMLLVIIVLMIPIDANNGKKIPLILSFNESLKLNLATWEFATAIAD